MRTLELGDFKISVEDSFGVHTLVLRGPDVAAGVVSGKSAQFRPTLVVARSERPIKDKAELEIFADVSVSLLKPIPGFREISRKTLATPAGNPAVLQRHRFLNEHGLEVEQLQLYVHQKGPALVLTATELAGESFSAHEESLRAMMMSVVEKTPAPSAAR
ncbi:MAG: hypothetical protein IT384_12845 [Deltaproteobacteria bacterium]|nr:hypothetical protein [Deltaproteobacteria bacterium]